MPCCSAQPRDRIFVKGCRFLSFAKNIGENIGKNIGKNLSSKYRQKHFGHAKQSAINALKTASKRTIRKSGNNRNKIKLPMKLQNFQKNSP